MDQVTRVSDRLTETVHLMLNDPTMGLYRLQEHSKRSIPTIVEKKIELQNLQSNIQGTCYDLDYSLKQATDKSKSGVVEISNKTVEEENIEQEPIEGFICPSCMNIYESQEELISHWATNHDTSTTSDTKDET